MKQFMNYMVILLTVVQCGCSGNRSSNHSQAAVDSARAAQLIDTHKIKSDIADVEASLPSGKPDTAKLKAAGADILSTTATVLSDSGINKLYGDTSDPSVNAARKILIKMRNNSGLTPAALDSIKGRRANSVNKIIVDAIPLTPHYQVE